jgi:hypothetical protein
VSIYIVSVGQVRECVERCSTLSDGARKCARSERTSEGQHGFAVYVMVNVPLQGEVGGVKSEYYVTTDGIMDVCL